MMHDTRDEVHKQLYDRALAKMIEDKGYDIDAYRFTEFPVSYYDAPSYVVVTYIRKPHSAEKVWLKEYWDNNYFAPDNISPLSYTFIEDESERSTLELQSVDYVRGIAKVHSRYSGKTAFVDMKFIDDDFPKSEDFSIDNTFTKQYAEAQNQNNK
jgi:hypothetical protein